VTLYKVVIIPAAAREIKRLKKRAEYPRIMATIRQLAIDPRPIGCIKLTDKEEWRIRVGD
jgi:mRNA interferase RelE/StbE